MTPIRIFDFHTGAQTTIYGMNVSLGLRLERHPVKSVGGISRDIFR